MSEITKQSNPTELVSFLDAVGRTIIGVFAGESDSSIAIQNPVVVNITKSTIPSAGGQQQQQLGLQLIPIFFREFLANKSDSIIFTYNKAVIAQANRDVTFDFKLKAQYDNIFATVAESVTEVAPLVDVVDTKQTEESA